MPWRSSAGDSWPTPSPFVPSSPASFQRAATNFEEWDDRRYQEPTTLSSSASNESAATCIIPARPVASEEQQTSIDFETDELSWQETTFMQQTAHTHTESAARPISEDRTTISASGPRRKAIWPLVDASSGRRRALPSQQTAFMQARNLSGCDWHHPAQYANAMQRMLAQPRSQSGGGHRRPSSSLRGQEPFHFDQQPSIYVASYGGGQMNQDARGNGQLAPPTQTPAFSKLLPDCNHPLLARSASDDISLKLDPSRPVQASLIDHGSRANPPLPLIEGAASELDLWGPPWPVTTEHNAHQTHSPTQHYTSSSAASFAVDKASSSVAGAGFSGGTCSFAENDFDWLKRTATEMSKASASTITTAATPADRATSSSKWASIEPTSSTAPAASRQANQVAEASRNGDAETRASSSTASSKTPTPKVKIPASNGTARSSTSTQPQSRPDATDAIVQAESPLKAGDEKTAGAQRRATPNKSTPRRSEPSNSAAAAEQQSTTSASDTPNKQPERNGTSKATSSAATRTQGRAKGTGASKWAQKEEVVAPELAPRTNDSTPVVESESGGEPVQETSARTVPAREPSAASGTGASKWAQQAKSPPTGRDKASQKAAQTDKEGSKQAVASDAPVRLPAQGQSRDRSRPPRTTGLAQHLAKASGAQRAAPNVEKQRDADKEAKLDELMARMKLKNEAEKERQAAIEREKKEYEAQVRKEEEQRRLYAEQERAARAAKLAAEKEKKERSAKLQAAVDAERAKVAKAKRKQAAGREWDSFKVDRSTPEPSVRPSEQAMAERQAREEELEAERVRHGGELPKYRQGEVWESVEHRED
ncbi:hypothetical protein ACM66B_001652 [Microbotryomycetes sp. NB124-2]